MVKCLLVHRHLDLLLVHYLNCLYNMKDYLECLLKILIVQIYLYYKYILLYIFQQFLYLKYK